MSVLMKKTATLFFAAALTIGLCTGVSAQVMKTSQPQERLDVRTFHLENGL